MFLLCQHTVFHTAFLCPQHTLELSKTPQHTHNTQNMRGQRRDSNKRTNSGNITANEQGLHAFGALVRVQRFDVSEVSHHMMLK